MILVIHEICSVTFMLYSFSVLSLNNDAHTHVYIVYAIYGEIRKCKLTIRYRTRWHMIPILQP